MHCYVYMNCMGKVLAEYLRAIPEFVAVYGGEQERGDEAREGGIDVFYMGDCVSTVNVARLRDADLFLFQHMTAKALSNRDAPHLDVADFCTESVLARMLKPSCRAISVPSPYFSGYFPDSLSPADLLRLVPDNSSSSLLSRACFPDYSFYRGLFDGATALTASTASTDNVETLQLVARLSDPGLLPASRVRENAAWSLAQLRAREVQNGVDVPLSDYIERNWRRVRLFHTTNHPTPALFRHVVTRQAELLGPDVVGMTMVETAASMDLKDMMEKSGRPPILPTVAAALGNDGYDGDDGDDVDDGYGMLKGDGPPYYVRQSNNGGGGGGCKEIVSLKEYVEHYVALLGRREH